MPRGLVLSVCTSHRHTTMLVTFVILTSALLPHPRPSLREHAPISRADALRGLVAATSLLSAAPAATAAADPLLRELLLRLEDSSPKQQSARLGDALKSGVGLSKGDGLVFPPWMEGRWRVRSRPLSTAAPLGRRFLPSDLARMRIGDTSDAPGLEYEVRFARRAADGVVVSDRANNLRAVQDAAAGYRRVEEARYSADAAKISVSYSPFGPNGTYPGASRAEIYLNWRRQSQPLAEESTFAFAEATRTVYLAQRRELSTVSDAETLCSFERFGGNGGGGVRARQRVLRFLTPNPNSIEGELWSQAQGRAVALLDYELNLERLGPAD